MSQNNVEFTDFLVKVSAHYPSRQAAQKLMGGITGDQVDGFFKLRTFQKPSQEGGQANTTMLPQQPKKPGTRRARPTLFNTFIPMGRWGSTIQKSGMGFAVPHI